MSKYYKGFKIMLDKESVLVENPYTFDLIVVKNLETAYKLIDLLTKKERPNERK